jgi:N-acyl-L-homoserine lactone synthetase
MEAIHRLRYRVYCLERGFLDGARYPDGLERDAWDSRAVHFAALGEDGEVLATVRLVADSSEGLPLGESAGLAVRALRTLAGSRMGEISRLILAPDARHHPAVAQALLFGLFRRLYEECRRLGLVYVLASMEGALRRLVGRLGFPFAAVGPAVEHMGLVLPCAARLEAMEPGYRRIADPAEQAAMRRVRFHRVRCGSPTSAPASGLPGRLPRIRLSPGGGPRHLSPGFETKRLVGGDRVVQ